MILHFTIIECLQIDACKNADQCKSPFAFLGHEGGGPVICIKT